jgi:hypothetical protein
VLSTSVEIIPLATRSTASFIWFWFLAPDEILVCVEAAHSVKRKLHFAEATDLCLTQGRIWIHFGLWLAN